MILNIAIFNDKNNVLKFLKTVIFKIDKITLLELVNLYFKSIFVFCGINNFNRIFSIFSKSNSLSFMFKDPKLIFAILTVAFV